MMSSLQINGRTLANPVGMSLYPTKMAVDGLADRRLLEWYRARARGGASVVVIEAIPVDPEQWKGSKQLRIHGERYSASYKTLLGAIQAEGALAFQHLTFSGKVKDAESGKKVRVVDHFKSDQLHEVIRLFSERCAELEALGVDGVEIQASYGGVVQDFLSPVFNARDDEFGGSEQARSHRAATSREQREKNKETRQWPTRSRYTQRTRNSGNRPASQHC